MSKKKYITLLFLILVTLNFHHGMTIQDFSSFTLQQSKRDYTFLLHEGGKKIEASFDKETLEDCLMSKNSAFQSYKKID